MGIMKAAVLPEPVRAMATTSLPARMCGMVLRWRPKKGSTTNNKQHTKSDNDWRNEAIRKRNLNRSRNLKAFLHDGAKQLRRETWREKKMTERKCVKVQDPCKTLSNPPNSSVNTTSHWFTKLQLNPQVPIDWKPPDRFFFCAALSAAARASCWSTSPTSSASSMKT